MEIEAKTVALGQPVALRSRAFTPAEEKRRAEGREVEVRKMMEDDEEMVRDPYAFEASRFCESWEDQWRGYFGSFEDTTNIPCMRFTDKRPKKHHAAFPYTTLQIFSLKVAGLREGLQWPLHVFGTVILRDSIDRNRNTIFDRRRDNCQILTQEVPCLTLTGPTRFVVLLDPVTFEVDLKVKGTTESEDKYLSSLAVLFMSSEGLHSSSLKRAYTSKLSTLEFALGQCLLVRGHNHSASHTWVVARWSPCLVCCPYHQYWL